MAAQQPPNQNEHNSEERSSNIMGDSSSSSWVFSNLFPSISSSLMLNPLDNLSWQHTMPAYMDVGLDPGLLSFTQCLQEGMNMDVLDYSDLSKSLSANVEPSPLGFAQPENAFQRVHLSPFSSSVMPSSSLLTAELQIMEASSTMVGTPVSSLSSSSSDAAHDILEDSSHGGVKISEKTSDEMLERSAVGTTKKQSKPRKKGQKRNTQPRVAFVTKSEVEHLEDGYRWRKYGQKAVKNSPYPRSYYRCTNSKCSVKKRVERSCEDPSMVITTYEGQHTHHSPASLRASASSEGTHFGEDPRLTSFSQSPFSFPSFSSMQPNFEPSSLLSTFDLSQRHGWQQQLSTAQGLPPPPRPPQQQQQQLQQLQQQQQQPSTQSLPDMGLLEDMLPPGVRKLS